MGTSWIANIIAALDQGRVARTPSANGAEGDIDLDLDEGRREFCAEVDAHISRVADGLCMLTAAYGCAVGTAEFVAVLMLLSLFPADRTAEGLIAHLVMFVVGI